MTLTEFLLARIAEDEAHARAAMGWQTGSRHEGQPLDWSIHMDRWSPDRVLAECAAKRRIVDEHAEGDPDRWLYGDLVDPFCQTCEHGHESVAYPCPTLRALALPYADRPDYDEAWRP